MYDPYDSNHLYWILILQDLAFASFSQKHTLNNKSRASSPPPELPSLVQIGDVTSTDVERGASLRTRSTVPNSSGGRSRGDGRRGPSEGRWRRVAGEELKWSTCIRNLLKPKSVDWSDCLGDLRCLSVRRALCPRRERWSVEFRVSCGWNPWRRRESKPTLGLHR